MPRSRRPSRAQILDRVSRKVVSCQKCPRLREYCERIGWEKRRAYRDEQYWTQPVPAFGDRRARLVIVGLAPAAHGANRTGRMFTGDRSGLWLYRALHKAGFANRPESLDRNDGLKLDGAYITAAVRCAPPANKPLPAELDSCRGYLIEELRVLTSSRSRAARPRVVLALGAIAMQAALTALSAVGFDVPTPRPRFGHLAEARIDEKLTLLCSYHPSQQNTQTGRLTEAMFDGVFARARLLLNGTRCPPRG